MIHSQNVYINKDIKELFWELNEKISLKFFPSFTTAGFWYIL